MTAFITIVLIVLLGVALLVLLSGIALYARLVTLRSAVTSSWSKIDRALNAVSDFPPDPKSEPDLQGMQLQLKELQDDIALAVRNYNKAVQDYNVAIETVPAQLIAKLYGFEKAKLFDTKIS